MRHEELILPPQLASHHQSSDGWPSPAARLKAIGAYDYYDLGLVHVPYVCGILLLIHAGAVISIAVVCLHGQWGALFAHAVVDA